MAGAYWALLNLICMVVTLYTAFPIHLARVKKWKSRESLIEAGIAAVSFLLFEITEDPHKPIQITDTWTIPMILLMFLCWLVATGNYKKLTRKNFRKAIDALSEKIRRT